MKLTPSGKESSYFQTDRKSLWEVKCYKLRELYKLVETIPNIESFE